MSRKKKFVVEIDEKYVDQKNPPNGNLYNRGSIQQKMYSTKHKKKLSDVDRQKKAMFSIGGEKKVCKQQKF